MLTESVSVSILATAINLLLCKVQAQEMEFSIKDMTYLHYHPRKKTGF